MNHGTLAVRSKPDCGTATYLARNPEDRLERTMLRTDLQCTVQLKEQAGSRKAEAIGHEKASIN